MSSPTELKAQLAKTEQALLEAEKEIDRQRRAAAAEAEIPEGAKALIAAVSKVDLPAFWDADPVLWFRQCESAFRRAGTVSSGVKFDHVVGKLPNAVSLSCRSLLLSINFEDKDAYERLKEHLCKNYSKSPPSPPPGGPLASGSKEQTRAGASITSSTGTRQGRAAPAAHTRETRQPPRSKLPSSKPP